MAYSNFWKYHLESAGAQVGNIEFEIVQSKAPKIPLEPYLKQKTNVRTKLA